MHKKLIFTVLIGDKDELKEPRVITPGWDYIAIVSPEHVMGATETVVDKGWTLWPVEVDGDPRKFSRKHKIKPYSFFNHYNTIIYIDASYRIKGDLDEFVAGKGPGVWMTMHPQRDCIYKEGQVVREKGLDDPEVVLSQVGNYRDEGYPDRNGLYRCGVIIRIGDTSLFDNMWWGEVSRGSWRDQISAPYASWKAGVPIQPIPHGQVEQYFKPYLHKPYKLTGGIVYAHTPEEIRAAGRDQWVCVGECTYAERATAAYKKVHLIATENAYIFPRWLFDHLWDVSRMEEMIRLYGGTICYFNE